MRPKIQVLADACQVVRPVFIGVIAMAIAAGAMAVAGWTAGSAVMAGLVVLVAAVLMVQVHRAVSRLRDQSAAVAKASLETEKHYVDVLGRIVKFVESRDRFIEGHSERVGRLAESLARKLDISAERAARLRLAGELHDVGLLAVPASALAQASKISVDSFRCIKQHCEIGHQVLKPLQSLSDVLAAVRHHHERMNGTGYPDGLAGEHIPLEARILAVADAFDAMTHDRPHRRAMGKVDAMRELHRCTPAGYDPICVDALADLVLLGGGSDCGIDSRSEKVAAGSPQ